MKRIIFLHIILLAYLHANSQNLSSKRWIVGGARGVEAEFTDTSRPNIKVIYDAPPRYYAGGHSNICDSASGKLLFFMQWYGVI
jgi:hypothetical protein